MSDISIFEKSRSGERKLQRGKSQAESSAKHNASQGWNEVSMPMVLKSQVGMPMVLEEIEAVLSCRHSARDLALFMSLLFLDML